MRKERSFIVFGLIVSAFIVLVKIYAGQVFSSYTFMVSGYYTLIDMAILFLAFMGSVARGRRANKSEPFGYGQLECYLEMLFGLFICILAIFIIVKSFFLDYSKTQLQILLVVIFAIIFKLVDANYKYNMGKKIQSEIMLDSSIDAYYDAILNILLIILVIISANSARFDIVGTIIGGILIIKKGLKIFFANLIALNGINIKPKNMIEQIKKIVNNNDNFTYSNCLITEINNYKKLTLEVLIEDDVSLETLERNKFKLIRTIKKAKIGIKKVEFEIYKK